MIRTPGHRKLTLYFSFLFTCFAATVNGQKNLIDGYIVKKNGDSLTGLIDYRDWGTTPQSIDFLDKVSQKSVQYGPDDLRAFGMNAERYESFGVRIFPYVLHPETISGPEDIGAPYDATVFLQVITAGRKSLWEYRHSSGMHYYFVSGEGGRPDQLRMITRVTNDNGTIRFEQLMAFRDQLSGLLSDCDAVQSRVRHVEYDAVSLQKLIFSYNNCGKDTVEKRPATGSRGAVRFFPFAGFVSSKMKFAGGDDPTVLQHFPSSNGATAGVGAVIVLPRYREQLSFVVDLAWQHLHSVSDSGRENSYINAVGHIDYSLLMLETLFRYSYPSGQIRPFIEAGMANGSNFGLNCYQTEYNHLYDPPTVDKASMLGGDFRRFQSGWIFGAGIGGRHWGLEGRVETNNGISNILSTSSKTTSWFVLLTYSL